MRWSYVVALVTCAFIAPVAAIGTAYTWAAERYRVLMAHGGAPSGTEYFVMLVGMMLLMGLAGTFVTVVVALCTGTAQAASSRGRLTTAAILTVATAWFAYPVTIMATMLPSRLPDPDRDRRSPRSSCSSARWSGSGWRLAHDADPALDVGGARAAPVAHPLNRPAGLTR